MKFLTLFDKLPIFKFLIVLTVLGGPLKLSSAKKCYSIDPSGAYSGDSTFYDPTIGQGACAFDPPNTVYPKQPTSPDDQYVVAISKDMFLNAQTCGACLEICNTSNKCVIGRVVDRCPVCQYGDLDLSPQLFQSLYDLGVGRATISWKLAPCPTKYNIYWQAGITSDWAAFQLRGQTWPVKSIEIQQGGSWVSLPQQYDNFYKARGLGSGPISLRVTLVDGSSVILNDIPIQENTVVYPGSVNYQGSNNNGNNTSSLQTSIPSSNVSTSATSSSSSSTATYQNLTDYGKITDGRSENSSVNSNTYLPFPNTCEDNAADTIFIPIYITSLVVASFVFITVSFLPF